MTQVYNYNKNTGEYTGEMEARLDPMETEVQGEDIYLLPADATFIEPPVAGANEMQYFDGETWSVVADFRGTVHYDEDGNASTIAELDELVPAGNTLEAPTEDLKQPYWNGSAWEEGGLIYLDNGPITTKAQIDAITARKIDALGEQKAKTLKLVAGDGACSEWDDFIVARDALVAEGDQFIIDNSLE